MTTINGRTPEEIRRGLECCSPKYESKHWVTCNFECPYRPEGAYCRNVLLKDNIAYIQQLEAERDQYKRERDAAVKDIGRCCATCKHYNSKCGECTTNGCFQISGVNSKWQWRGVEVE